jgi:hypothetical protein
MITNEQEYPYLTSHRATTTTLATNNNNNIKSSNNNNALDNKNTQETKSQNGSREAAAAKATAAAEKKMRLAQAQAEIDRILNAPVDPPCLHKPKVVFNAIGWNHIIYVWSSKRRQLL